VSEARYRRIVLKLSGEVLGGSSRSSLDAAFMDRLAAELKLAVDRGIQVGVVLGGGNILRGGQAAGTGLGRVPADYIGMMGTVINGIAMRDVGERQGLRIAVLNTLPGSAFTEPYSPGRAIDYLEEGRLVFFVGGTGSPFLTTDTAAALRAAEIDADVLLKATKVDGVYSSDPLKDPSAKRFDKITYRQALDMNLTFMDRSALFICSETGIPIVVFDILREDNLRRAIMGESIGTVVEGAIDD
jgi:uridylate kinase